MKKDGTVVAVFADHHPVEAAVKRLAEVGFDKKHLSVVGNGYHTNENDGGFYSTGDRIKFWGELGTFWGGLLGWFGGLFLTIPVVGHVIVLGSTAAIFISVIESVIEGAIGGAIAAGGLTLQLRFHVGALCLSLMGSSPQRPGDDEVWFDSFSSEARGDAADFLHGPADERWARQFRGRLSFLGLRSIVFGGGAIALA